MPRWWTFLLVAALPAVALADGVGPARPMTPAEAAAFQAVRAAVRDSVPKPAAGYATAFRYESEFADGTVPEALKPGEPFRMPFRVTHTLERGKEPDPLQVVMMQRVKGTPEQQARLTQLEVRERELTSARDKTRDRTEKDRLRAELKAVRTEQNELNEQVAAGVQAWIASGGPASEARALEASLPPTRLEARFLVNADIGISEKAVPYRLEGFPLAFEQGEGCQEYDTACITVFIGPYERKHKGGSHWLYALGGGGGGGFATKARGIVLVVSGPKDRPESARAFLSRIDLARLAALVR